ncbi:MAG: hypothetical protein LBI03_00440 [Clostridiales bacterium]|jgi:uncharacterized membrane protein|nr:hypothetical protein [Clostridiales bacterium]
MKDVKNVVIVVLSVVCILAFFVFAGVTNAISIPEIPASFLGAAAGAAITAVVTLLLLQGQTRAEEIKERNVKVFEKKSAIFSEYIDIVWSVWEDRKVTDDEFKKLMGKYYKNLMLYMSASSAEIIGKQLQAIGPSAGNDDPSEKEQKELQTALINIINTLSDEISLGGHVDQTLFIDLGEKAKEAEARSRRSNTSFKMLGIKLNTELVLKAKPNIKCWTTDEKNQVKDENGEILSISALASRELERSANGFSEFMLNGKTLYEMRGK